MEGFRRPGERPPRAGHRRSASASLATLVPVTLQALQASRERGELEVRAAEIVDAWIKKQATTTQAAAAAAAPAVTETHVAPAIPSPQASLPPSEQDAAIAAMASTPLPPSDDEEAMDSSSSRKRMREAESEEEEQTGRRKLPPPTAPPCPESRDDGDAISRRPGDSAASSSPPAARDGAPADPPPAPALLLPSSTSAAPRTPGESSAASFALSPREGARINTVAPPAAGEAGASSPASSATADARDAPESVPLGLAHDPRADRAPAGPTQHGLAHPAARFLKDPPHHTLPRQEGKNKKQKKAGKSSAPKQASPPAAPPAPRPTLAGSGTPTAKAAAQEAPSTHAPPAEGFQLVLSKADRRRARAPVSAAIPVNPAVIGTALFRPSVVGGTFRGAPRLSLAAVLSARPGVAAVRVNHRRNIVAADATTQRCLEELLATTELRGIPVTARQPAERGRSTGFVHGADGIPADADLLGAIESGVPVLAATREADTITIRFAGPVPPEHVSLYKLRFRVRPSRPRPLQCQQCGRFGHVAASCDSPSSCRHCGRSHEQGDSCPNAAHCRNCGGHHPANTPACPRWQEERRVATILATAPAPLSRRAVRAGVREENLQAKATSTPVQGLSYAQALAGLPQAPQQKAAPPGRPPTPAPRKQRRQPPATPGSEPTTAPASLAMPGPDPRDQIIASLQLALKAIGEMLPAESPLRAICLQAVAVPTTVNQHG